MTKIHKRKLNKACTNCRKRKIKCSGTYPCLNCTSYGCLCQFIERRIRNSSKSSSPESTSLSVNDNLLSTTPHKHTNITTHPSCPQKDYSIIRTSMQESNPWQQGNDLYNHNGLYGNDIESQKEYVKLKTTLKQLNSLPESTDLIKQMILQTTEKLNDFIKNWEPTIHWERLSSLIENNNKQMSIETKLLKNKYRDQIYLGRFASFNSSSSSSVMEEKTFSSVLPLTDDINALYSPFDAFSSRGLGSLIQKYTLAVKQRCDNVEDASEKLKATIYIILRFFDICSLHLMSNVELMAHPLETYLRRNIVLTPQGNDDNNKHLVSMIIKEIPESFIKYLTTKSTIRNLLTLINKDFEMFTTLIEIYQLHRNLFEVESMKLSYENYHPDQNEIHTSFELLIDFCKMQDILLALGYSYYNSTLYHLDEYNSLDYLESLLLFLDHQEWMDQGYGYGKVLIVATDCALNMGLNRWEFYVGIDEDVAIRRRNAWWKVYCLEKYFSMKIGRLSTIDDSKINCLLPEPMRRVGFIDLKDFSKRVSTLKPDSSIFNEMSIQDSKIYGTCGQTILISDFYQNVLFSDEYTSLKNVGSPQFIRENHLTSIFQQCDITRNKFKILETQMNKLFTCAKSTRHNATAVPKDDKSQSSEYVMSYYFYSSLFLKSSFTLISRLTGFPRDLRTNEKIREYSRMIYEHFNKCSDYMLSLETSYEIWKQFKIYSFLFVMISFNMDNKNSFVNIDDIIKVFRIFSRILTFAGQLEEFRLLDPHISRNQTLQEFERNLTMLTILIRVLVLDFMLRKDYCADEVVQEMKSRPHGSNVAEMVHMFVDHKSYLYNFVLQPIQKMGFHLKAQKLLENLQFQSFPKVIGNSAVSLASMKCKGRDNPKDSVGSTEEALRISPRQGSLKKLTDRRGLETPESLPVEELDSNVMSLSKNSATSTRLIPVISKTSKDDFGSNSNADTAKIPTQKPQQAPGEDISQDFNLLSSEVPNDVTYNLGTLEDFVNNTDLNDLYRSLWNDNFLDMM